MTTSLPARQHRVHRVFAAVLGLLLLAGCASLPTSGPVVESDASQRQQDQEATGIDPRPPAKGASRTEIVTGFLEAMTSWPIKTSVAKQYLTRAAGTRWDPERATVVYDESLSPRESGSTVSVQLTRADLLDRVGAWRGPLPASELDLSFELTIEHGEYRIDDPPDALLVPANWFQQRYRQVSLYYFDPGGTMLVPEPVFVPVGDQLATRLVSSLVAGPPPRARGIVRTFLPSGLGAGLSVPVSSDGVAQVSLEGDSPQLSGGGAELMLAQIAWTLRQSPQITAVRVSIGGVEVPIPGGAAQYDVSAARAYDPTVTAASTQLFALAGGRLFEGAPGDLAAVSGPFGQEDAALESVAVSPDGAFAAGVDAAGHRVRRTTVEAAGDSTRAHTVLSGGTYLRPTWDTADRLWVVERRTTGAVLWLIERRRAPRQVSAEGLTGSDVRSLAVSRDGTRLVGVVRTGRGDEVRSVRVVLGPRAQVQATTNPVVVRPAERERITDLSWATQTRVALLTATSPGSLYEVDLVSADGASVGIDAPPTVVTGKVIGLATAPVDNAPMLAVYEGSYDDITSGSRYPADGVAPLTDLDYVG